jgi:ribonucleotide monophosphatase NagD (HAD superfamily)
MVPSLSTTPPPAGVFSAIYAVGDNPAADVRGANSAGHPWVSVLVRTGVFQGPPASNSPSDPAHVVVEDVLAAVQAAFHRSRSQRWHSMR